MLIFVATLKYLTNVPNLQASFNFLQPKVTSYKLSSGHFMRENEESRKT